MVLVVFVGHLEQRHPRIDVVDGENHFVLELLPRLEGSVVALLGVIFELDLVGIVAQHLLQGDPRYYFLTEVGERDHGFDFYLVGKRRYDADLNLPRLEDHLLRLYQRFAEPQL